MKKWQICTFLALINKNIQDGGVLMKRCESIGLQVQKYRVLSVLTRLSRSADYSQHICRVQSAEQLTAVDRLNNHNALTNFLDYSNICLAAIFPVF